MNRDALVLTGGGGCNAAYEAGVVKALTAGKWGATGKFDPVQPSCYCGMSVGGFNAAVMASRPHLEPWQAAHELERIWIDRVGVDTAVDSNGIFRVRANPAVYMNAPAVARSPVASLASFAFDMAFFASQTMQRMAIASSAARTVPDGVLQLSELNAFLDFSPLRKLVQDTIAPEAIAGNGNQLRLTALDWATGRPRVFTNLDFAGTAGHDIVLSTNTMPIMMPPVSVHGVPYVDASILNPWALKPAIDVFREGGSKERVRLFAVYIDANISSVPMPVLTNTFSTSYRLFLLAVSRAINADIHRAAAVNEQLRLLGLIESAVTGKEQRFQDFLGESGEKPAWTQFKKDLEHSIPVEVHRFRQTKNIQPYELTAFERSSIRQLIEDGYQDTLHHDCDESGCILLKT